MGNGGFNGEDAVSEESALVCSRSFSSAGLLLEGWSTTAASATEGDDTVGVWSVPAAAAVSSRLRLA